MLTNPSNGANEAKGRERGQAARTGQARLRDLEGIEVIGPCSHWLLESNGARHAWFFTALPDHRPA